MNSPIKFQDKGAAQLLRDSIKNIIANNGII